MPITATEVLDRCRQAYDALSSYVGKTQVRHQVPKSVEQQAKEARRRRIIRPSAYITYQSSATVWFQRPDCLRVKGRLSETAGTKGTPFTIISDGHETWTSWEIDDYVWEPKEDAERAISAFTGVSLGACTTIPALLLHTRWGDPFRGLVDISPQVERDTIRKRAAYRVEARHPYHESVTVWVDAESFLLVQLRERTDWSEAMERVRQKSEELRTQGMVIPPDPDDHWEEPFLFSEQVETFTLASANTPLPVSFFARPDGAPATAE